MDAGVGDEVKRLRAELDEMRANFVRALWLLLLCLVLYVVNSVVLPWFADDGIVVAREVWIEDADGHVRASLTTEPLGTAGLQLFDPSGHPRVRLTAADTHGTLEILDPERHTQVRLSAIENLSGLHLANGSRSAQMVASIESTAVTLADLDESATAVLRAEPGGTDLELARNKTGEPPRLASLSAGSGDPDKGAALTLAGPLQFVQATVHPIDGEPRITLAGDTRLESRTAPSGEPWQRFERPEAPLQAP